MSSPFSIAQLLQPVGELLARGVDSTFPAAQLVVRLDGRTVLRRAAGSLHGERSPLIDLRTRFDLASLTKPFVAAAFLTLVEQGRATIDQPVVEVLPELRGRRPIAPYEDPLVAGKLVTSYQGAETSVDAAAVTFRHLLAHSSGLPAWRPLYRQADRAAALRMALYTSFAYPIGEHTVYSDIGFILLGLAVERLSGRRLDHAVRDLVTSKLQLDATGYLPLDERSPADRFAATEHCTWRGRRMVGAVHDENAYALGGIAGHAGLFATADDVAAFGQALSDGTLLAPATVAEMTSLQIEAGSQRRGLGVALWSPDPESSGNAFSRRAWGHTGFTGTSFWADPERRLVVALLTNDVYFGRTNRSIGQFRRMLHQAVVDAVDRMAAGG